MAKIKAVTGYRSQVSGHKSQVAGRKSQVAGRKSQVAGRKSRVTGKEKENYIKFLGTAGARFVMIKQLRSSGGLWISYKGTNLIIDPGPGSIARCALSRPKIDPTQLDGIILTHRHLDHSNDINVMIEAMTEGGFKKRGVVFLPADAMDDEPVILRHLRPVVERIEILDEKKAYTIGGISFSVPSRQRHPVATYGLRFGFKKTVSLITDTQYFAGIEDIYKADIVIINVVFYEERPTVEHLCLREAQEIIRKIKPETAILTHFGMTMLTHKPHLLAEQLAEELHTKVIAAYDGMRFGLT